MQCWYAGIITSGTATYSAGQLTLPTEAGMATFTLTAVDNNVDASDKTITLTISNLQGEPDGWGALGEQRVHDITIMDEDKHLIGFALTGAAANSRMIEVDEDADTVSLMLQLSQSDGMPYRGSIPNGLALSHDGTRTDTDSSDFSIQFADSEEGTWSAMTPGGDAGSVSVLSDANRDGMIPITITITDDNVAEDIETFSYTFQEATGFPTETWELDLDADDFTLVINDDDQATGFAVNASELDENATDASVDVTVNIRPVFESPTSLLLTLSGDLTEATDYSIAIDPPAVTYNSTSGILTIPARTDTFDIVIAPTPDSDGDHNKTIVLTLAERSSPEELPYSRDLTATTHTVTIIDSDRIVGITTTAPAASATTNRFEEGDSLTIEVASNNMTDFDALDLASDIALTVEMSVTGDTDVMEDNRPDHNNSEDAAEYTTDLTSATLMLDKDTGTGSFTFTAVNDEIAEGIEYVTFTITNLADALPKGWAMGNASITIPVAGSDNAARFTEWPRDDSAAEFANLSATIMEGDPASIANLMVLLTNYPPFGDIPLKINVAPSEHASAISFTNLEEDHSTWNSSDGIFTIKRNIVSQTDPAAGLEIAAVDNDVLEATKTISITLEQPSSNFPTYWGTVDAVADAGDGNGNTAQTSLTFTLMIEDDDKTIAFAQSSSEVVEGGSAEVEVQIVPPLADAATVSLTPSGGNPSDYTITATSTTSAASYDSSNNILSLPAGTETVTVTIKTEVDTNMTDETITLTLADRGGAEALPGYRIVSDKSAHELIVRDPRSISFATQDPAQDIRWHTTFNRRPVTVGHAPHLVHQILNEPSATMLTTSPSGVGSSVSVDIAATTDNSHLVELSGGVVLNVIALVTGDLTVHSAYRNRPANVDGTADFSIGGSMTVGTVTIGSNGQGSFDFTVLEDEIPEGREIVTLTLAESAGSPLPDHWSLDNSKPYYILIESNDNAARFAEDSVARFPDAARPDQGTGLPASLNQTVREGDIMGALILLTNHPSESGRTALSFELEISEGHETDIEFFDFADPNRTALVGRPVIVRRAPSDIDPSTEEGSHYLPSASSPPVLTQGFGIRIARDSDVNEEPEVVTVKLSEGILPWGSIRDFPDAGDHNGFNPVETSTTITLTIVPDESNIFFTKSESEVREGSSVDVVVRIAPPLEEATNVSLTVSGDEGADYTITASDPSGAEYANGTLTLPASVGEVKLRLSANVDENVLDERVMLELAPHATTPLPSSHSIAGRATHTLMIKELRSIGFMTGTPDEDTRWHTTFRRGGGTGIPVALGHTPHHVHMKLNEPSQSVTVNVSATANTSLLSEIDGVALNVVASMMGDPAVLPRLRNSPVNSDGTDDFTIGALTLDSTGRGNFTFTVNDDNVSEGREIVALTLAENDTSPLPAGWILDTSKPYYILIEANDNAARFAEWPRPGTPPDLLDFFPTASLDITIEEVAEDPFNPSVGAEAIVVLLTNLRAPPSEGIQSLPFIIDVPEEHRSDVTFELIDPAQTALGRQGEITAFLVNYVPSNGFNRSMPTEPAAPPYLAARLAVRAVDDILVEEDETFMLTLSEPMIFPSDWGSVTNLSDTGDHNGQNPVMTSKTIRVTIPANDQPSSSPSPPTNPSSLGGDFRREAQAH